MAVKFDRTLWTMAALWLMSAGAALIAMADYSAEPGAGAQAPLSWPDDLHGILEPDPARPTLVLFAHPLCPCTRASLWELESIANSLYGMVSLHVLFFEPDDPSSDRQLWAASDLKQIASRIPGMQMHADVEGRIAAHFGAYTSGQVLLYGTDKSLQFEGGVTPSRGHMGTNPGKAAVISAIVSDEGVDALAPRHNPVFGCSLHGQSDDDRKLINTPYN